MKLKVHLIACATSVLLGAGLAHAADPSPHVTPTPQLASQPLSATAGKYNSIVGRAEERSALAEALRAGGGSRADIDKILAAQGYRISAINDDKRDYLEYEVVRGKNSHEVQVNFDNGTTARPTQIEVTRNVWPADTTTMMVDDPSYRPPGAIAADPTGRYSDKRYLKDWTDEKNRLEKALPTQLKADGYPARLEALGYRVTAVNHRERDSLEFEIVKGVNSYEVQIDMDPTSRLAREVKVTSNLWEADTTDAATDRAERNSK